MKIILNIERKPVTINHALKKTKRGITYKTSDAKAYEKQLRYMLNRYKNGIEGFLHEFNERKQSIEIQAVLLVPERDYWTKSGSKHKRNIDFDNWYKYSGDVIASALGIDDGLIIGANNFYTLPYPDNRYKIIIDLYIVDNEIVRGMYKEFI